jgi:hypothetical protein
MITKQDIINSRVITKRPLEDDLRRLPFKHGYIYGRVSSPAQVRDSRESIREIATLLRLAKADGFKTNLDPAQVEAWLVSIAAGVGEKGVKEEGQVTVDVRDLALSGQLPAEEREGMADLQRGILAGKVGAVYVTEGVSRLSRDVDYILPFVLLKQLKDFQVRVRTPEGIWNPVIERDWGYLADEFGDAIGELKTLNKRLFRRKAQKAARGEFVGEPVPPGFIVPVVSRKPNGQHEYGKLQPYPPHAEIDERILRIYVRNGGGLCKIMKEVSSLAYPFFPEDLSYMERLTSLRKCKRLANGYEISPNLVTNLATNLKMIGVWQWGDCSPIPDNHQAAVPEELFLEAYQLARKPGKPKGRAAMSEPLEWAGILYCANHPEMRRLICHNKASNYCCERDYKYGKGPGCVFKSAHLLDKPLSDEILGQLKLDPCIEEIISRLESEADSSKLDRIRERQQISILEKDINKWKALLPCCVDETSGAVDREREKYYWEQIHQASKRLEDLKATPLPSASVEAPDYTGLRDFLKALPQNWTTFSRSLRNRFLKSLIERVELKGGRELEATIFWKAGLRQKVLIPASRWKRLKEKLWTNEEDKSLRDLFPSSSEDVIAAALRARTWKSITLRANRLKIRRKRRANGSTRNHRDGTHESGVGGQFGPEEHNLKLLQQPSSGRSGWIRHSILQR